MKHYYVKNHNSNSKDKNILVRIWDNYENAIGKILSIFFVNKADNDSVRQNSKITYPNSTFSFINIFKVSYRLLKSRKRLLILLILLAILAPIGYLSLKYVKSTQANQWWPSGTSWKHRKQLTVANNSAGNLSSGATVTITIDTSSLVSAGKLQSDCDDLRILYQPSGTTTTEVTRHLIFPSGTTCSTSTTTKVNFRLQAALSTGSLTNAYFVYYNNTGASTPSATDDAFNIGSANATLVCPLDGTTTCIEGETPSSESGAVRYSGSKGAITFDGINDYTSATSGTIPNTFTLESWVKPLTFSSNYMWGWDGSAGPHLRISATQLRIVHHHNATNVYTVNYNFSLNTWYHIAYSFTQGDGSLIKVFVNGQLQSGSWDGSGGNSGLYSGTTFTIGRGSFGGNTYNNVAFDEFRFSNIRRYEASFTPSTGPFVRDTNTVILYHFDENGDDPRNTGKVIDDSGLGKHGTITGAKYISGLVGINNGTSDTGNVVRHSYAGHEGIFIEEGTTNKITNPGFDHTTYNTHWDAVGANLTASENTSVPYYKFGSKSLKLIANASAISGTSNMDTIGIDPNSTATHTLSFYAYDATTGNVGGTVSSSIVKPVWEGVAQSGATYTDMGGGWWRVTYSTTTTDATNEYGVEPQVSKTVYIDGVQLETKAYATSFTDGTLGTGYTWAGTAHESTNSRTAGALGYAASSNVNGSAGAISFWVNFSYYPAVGAYQELLHSGTWTGNNAISFFVNTQNSNQFFLDYKTNGTGNTGRVSTSNRNLSGWHHITGVWQTNDLRLYIDNTLIGTDTTVDTNATFSSALTFDNFFGRTISDLRIFDNALTTAQVTDLYQAGLVSHIQSPETVRAGGLNNKGFAPVALWHMDEGFGTTTYDSTTNANNLTITGPTWFTAPSNGSNTKGARSLKFDGSNDYLVRSTDNDFDFSTSSFTINGSFRHSSTISGTDTLLARYGSAGYKIYMNSSGYLCFGIDDDTTWGPDDSACSTVSYADSKWHTFSAVKTATTSITLYVDGNQVGTDASIAATGSLNTGSSLYMGIDSDASSNPWDGFIDEVGIFGFAFSTGQVKENLTGSQSSVVLGAQTTDVLSEGLVGYWRMDESSANTCADGAEDSCDSSGNANDMLWNANATTIVGKYENGTSFDGTGDYLCTSSASTCADDADFDSITDLTISAWVKPTSVSGTQYLVSKTNSASSNTGHSLRIVNDTVQFNFKVSGNSSITSGSVLTAGTWHHIVAIRKANTEMQLFVNGVLQANGNSQAGSQEDSSGAEIIGCDYQGANCFTGSIDEVRVYRKTFSPAEVQQLYNFAPGPYVYLNFDDKSGTTLNDSSGRGYSGTWNGNGSHWAQGKFGGGGKFDGSTDYIGFSSLPKPNNMPITLMFWTKPSSASPVGIFDSAPSAVDVLRNYSSGNVEWWNNSPSVALNLNANQWQHVGIIYDFSGSTRSITYYKNGVKQGTTTASGTSSFAWTTFRLGNINSGSAGWYSGSLDDFKIYNYARTPKQILEDMNAGHPAGGSPIASQTGYWKLDEGYGTIGQDSTENDNDLTLSTATSAWSSSGKFGKAWDGNGSRYMSRADDADFDITAIDDYGISLWFKSDSASNPGATEYILNKANATTAGYAVYANTSGQICFGIDDDTTWGPDIASCTSSDYYDNTWHHVFAVRDYSGTDKTYIYIDGKAQDNDSDSTTATLANSLSLYVSDRDETDNGDEFAGDVDEIKIYRSALSASEVLIDYTRGSSTSFGALSDNSTYEKNSANQEYCVPGDSTSCAGPVAEWKMDEKTGTSANDTSGNGNTGTLISGPTWTQGKVGSAVNFDGDDDYVETGNVDLLGSSNDVTVEAWVKPGTTQKNYANIIDHDHSTGGAGNYGNWVIQQDNTTTNNYYFAFTYDGTNFDGLGKTTQLTAGTWQHFVTVKSGTNLDHYLNGVKQGTTTTVQSNITTETTKIRIGDHVHGVNDRNFNGSIDNVRVYNYARTAAQIAWGYNRGAPIAHWKMDECSGSTANDSSGNGNTGTITIAATGTQTSAGTCSSGTSTEAWNNGTTGKYNSSLNFDGTDDYVYTQNIDTLNTFTYMAWIKLAATPTGAHAIFDKEIGGSLWPSVRLYIGPNVVYFDFYKNTSTQQVVSTSTTLNTGEWYHLTGVYTGSKLQIYVNGRFSNEADASGTPNDINNELTIGAIEDNSAPFFESLFNGQIDDARIYSYALTATQIKNVMNEGSAVRFGPQTGSP